MLRNKIGPVLKLELGLFLFIFFFFFETSSSSCRENEIFKNKQNKKLGPVFNTKKAKIGPVLTLQHMRML